jgi:hypothetical protein
MRRILAWTIPVLAAGAAARGNPEPEYLQFERRAAADAARLETEGERLEAAARLEQILTRYRKLPQKLRERHEASALIHRERIRELKERDREPKAWEARVSGLRGEASKLEGYEAFSAFLAQLSKGEREALGKEAAGALERRAEELRPRRWGDIVADFNELLRVEEFRRAREFHAAAAARLTDPEDVRAASDALRRLEGRCKRLRGEAGGAAAARAEPRQVRRCAGRAQAGRGLGPHRAVRVSQTR